jgi:CubicO group peptidase (beta-lactamase class C family)
MTLRRNLLALAVGLLLSPAALRAQNDASLCAAIEPLAREVLKDTGAPSASVAVVREGKIACLAAWGDARVAPKAAAGPAMRYSIGSVSKQFTGAAILMLAEEGKLSLDDPVAKFLPDLTQAKDIRIRQLLSHTSGYQDYWPQDYVPPFMLQPMTAQGILDRWAKKPLDFAPGSQYQYSNTGYVAAGMIVEKASGTPLIELLQTRVFRPLAMTSIVDIDKSRLTESDPTGYQRFALGPLRVAPKEGKGWLFAAAELAMTAEDLARWNISLMNETLLKPESYRQLESAVLLTNGVASGYGLGVSVGLQSGRRVIGHGGEVSGFTATNMVFPDEKAAITVLVNQDAIDTGGDLAQKIVPLLFEKKDLVAASEARAKKIIEGLQKGTIDRLLFTDNCNAYFSAQAVADAKTGLGSLGAPTEVKQTRQSERGGMTFRAIDVKFKDKTVEILERDMPGGKIEQFQVTPKGE